MAATEECLCTRKQQLQLNTYLLQVKHVFAGRGTRQLSNSCACFLGRCLTGFPYTLLLLPVCWEHFPFKFYFFQTIKDIQIIQHIDTKRIKNRKLHLKHLFTNTATFISYMNIYSSYSLYHMTLVSV